MGNALTQAAQRAEQTYGINCPFELAVFVRKEVLKNRVIISGPNVLR